MKDFFRRNKYGISQQFFAPEGDPGGDPGAGDGKTDPPAKTFSQEDLDKKIEQRLKREREKYADYEDLKKAREELDEIKKGQMTEQEKLKAELEKAQAEANEAAAKTAALELERTKEKICREAGLPDGFADRLKGSTEEELKADVELMKKLVPATPKGGKGAPVGGGDPGNTSTGNALTDAISKHYNKT